MRKILAIASIALILSLSGCVGWVHFRDNDERNRKPQENQDQVVPRDTHGDQQSH